MTVAFTVACPDCGHELVARANPGNHYDWDWEECVCQRRAWRKR